MRRLGDHLRGLAPRVHLVPLRQRGATDRRPALLRGRVPRTRLPRPSVKKRHSSSDTWTTSCPGSTAASSSFTQRSGHGRSRSLRMLASTRSVAISRVGLGAWPGSAESSLPPRWTRCRLRNVPTWSKQDGQPLGTTSVMRSGQRCSPLRASSAPSAGQIVAERLVRFTDQFFDRLGLLLPGERGAPHTTTPDTATGDGRTPTPSAPRRSVDPAPRSGSGHDQPHGPRTPDTTADPAGSPPQATTRHRATPARARQARECPRARSHHRYREHWTRASPPVRRQTSAEWRGPWPRWWTPIPRDPTSHHPHFNAKSLFSSGIADCSARRTFSSRGVDHRRRN